MDSQQKFSEIARLAALLCDGQVAEAELFALEQLLRDDPEAQAYYRQYMAIDVALEWTFVDRAFRGSPAQGELPASPPRSPILGFLGDVGRQGWGFVSGHNVVFSLLAVLVAVAALVAVVVRNGDLGRQDAATKSEIADHNSEFSSRNSEIPNFPRRAPSKMVAGEGQGVRVARLVRANDCRWNGQSSAPEVGQPLPAGQSLHLAAGVAEIDFDCGAKVILQSPAAFQLLSANSARLEMGKATVEIKSETARGFKILTPEATFVDQGTEFGVEVTPRGSSKIHVFRGQVDVDRKAREGQVAPLTHRLVENAGARMEAGENGMTLVEETGECFIRSMDEAGRDQHVVAYWRFDDRPVGILLPDTGGNRQPGFREYFPSLCRFFKHYPHLDAGRHQPDREPQRHERRPGSLVQHHAQNRARATQHPLHWQRHCWHI